MAVTVSIAEHPYQRPAEGKAGVRCHVPGAPATVSALAGATGGIRPGGLVETASERKITKLKS